MGRITWLGHNTTVVEWRDRRVITDPLLTRRVAHLRRHVPLPGALGRIDVVLLTHVHGDHVHLPSLRRIDRSAAVVLPPGASPLVEHLGFAQVVELAVGEVRQVAGVPVRGVPARHKAGRGPHSRVRSEPMGFVVGDRSLSVYVAGDTDLFDGMAEVAGVDVALLPIWGWGPSIGVGHLDPVRAVDAVRLVDPTVVVPVHWGTYSPAVLGRRRPPWLPVPAVRFTAAMEEAGLAHRLRLLQPLGSLDP